MDGATLARAYYRHIDAGEYDDLAGVLAEGFRHDRPDRTIEGRDEFVSFMRDRRPETDTSHRLDTVYVGDGRVAVEGRLVRDDGTEMFRFVDAFRFDGDVISDLRTYTN